MAVSLASTVSNVSAGGYTPTPAAADVVARTDVVNQKSTAGVANPSQGPSSEHVARAVGQVNDAFTQRDQNLSASIVRDKATGITVVQVTEKSTNQVVSQFPSKAIVALAEALTQSQNTKGSMLNVVG
jgi:uncharacterized FlaG/YvyC family protein